MLPRCEVNWSCSIFSNSGEKKRFIYPVRFGFNFFDALSISTFCLVCTETSLFFTFGKFTVMDTSNKKAMFFLELFVKKLTLYRLSSSSKKRNKKKFQKPYIEIKELFFVLHFFLSGQLGDQKKKSLFCDTKRWSKKPSPIKLVCFSYLCNCVRNIFFH